MEIEKPIERAAVILKMLRQFRDEYISTWNTVTSKSERPKNQEEAKEQFAEIHKYMKKIQEDGFSPSKKAILKKVKKALETKNYSSELRQIIIEELEKIQEVSEHYQEFQIIKEFLDLICDLPYGVLSKDNFDLTKAKQVLDEDHFGMEKVKEKILEFIAVAKLRQGTKGKNLLLVGPPGTGKTSVASSIAKSLGREFVRISLGGESDVALIKGHRKTYVGAYPGKLVMALKQAKTENPVILLDEIDKIARSFKGNIQDTLLEVLDPAQNHSFRDNYLEAPLDLSKVLFICSANLLDTISDPLLDRMEVIELSGYTMSEKLQIALKYLIPKTLKAKGLVADDISVKLPEDTLMRLIDQYAREAGVRSLEKKISRIFEKICLKIVETGVKNYTVSPDELKKYLGPPIFSDQRLYPANLPRGVSIGLSYSALGGGVLFIETAKSSFPPDSIIRTQVSDPREPLPELPQTPPKPADEGVVTIAQQQNSNKAGGSIIVTGSLGKVMQESIQIAHTLAKSVCFEKFENKYLEENNIHIHFPEGASKKDGPSAGITICTALVSLATKLNVPADLAMTGEVSLNGKVLKIGGLREKALAAKREGLKRILLPASNRPDYDELKDEVKKDLEFIFVKDFDDVMKIAFGQDAEERAKQVLGQFKLSSTIDSNINKITPSFA